ncbi:reverse transcriptase [Tanacetum coccineum]|uniref:Reverse transcriptase n=1 Tax=Tanacetum coccineum TaxID=301880 RepID=A0ABQ5FP30_9ASTR
MEDPGLFTMPCRLGDSKPFDTLVNLGSCVNIIPLYLSKKLNIGLLEETDHIFGLADRTKSYPVGIVKDVEVHIGKLKLLNDLYVIDMKKDHKTLLLLGRGFLATSNAVIDCRMANIAVGEGITRSVFGVKGVDLGEKEAPYWTTLGKRESYKLLDDIISPPHDTKVLIQGVGRPWALGFAAALAVLVTGASQSRQHVDISLIHLESRKSPTAELFDVDSGRISIHHCEY